MADNLMVHEWVPEACTLATLDKAMRREELDDFFIQDVLAVDVVSARELSLRLRPEPAVAERAAGLAAKESGCCSFFTFVLTVSQGRVAMEIVTAPGHESVLAALAHRVVSAQSGPR